jgi:hypothetical protein
MNPKFQPRGVALGLAAFMIAAAPAAAALAQPAGYDGPPPPSYQQQQQYQYQQAQYEEQRRAYDAQYGDGAYDRYEADQARHACHEQKKDNQVAGAVLGGIAGAVLGSNLGHGGGREGGAIIGGVGGAAAGYAISGAGDHCPPPPNAYGYYDDDGRWVPNRVTDDGYYDQNGRWVETATPPVAAGFASMGPAPGGPGPWAETPLDTRDRESRLAALIEHRLADHTADERAARRALRDLDDIRRIDADYRAADGRLTPDQRRDILARLDALRERLGLAG